MVLFPPKLSDSFLIRKSKSPKKVLSKTKLDLISESETDKLEYEEFETIDDPTNSNRSFNHISHISVNQKKLSELD